MFQVFSFLFASLNFRQQLTRSGHCICQPRILSLRSMMAVSKTSSKTFMTSKRFLNQLLYYKMHVFHPLLLFITPCVVAKFVFTYCTFYPERVHSSGACSANKQCLITINLNRISRVAMFGKGWSPYNNVCNWFYS